jgi:hypothetical protein
MRRIVTVGLMLAFVVAPVLGASRASASLASLPATDGGPAAVGRLIFCHAKMTIARPKQYTTTYVVITSWADTDVTTTAHYRTTTTTHHGETNSRGKAHIRYYISGATVGHKVIVDVDVQKSGHHASCHTSFVPTSDAVSPWCSASASSANDGYPADYYINIKSNQPDTEATASDSSNSWSDETNGSGSVRILLYYQSPGESVNVAVGGARCTTSI